MDADRARDLRFRTATTATLRMEDLPLFPDPERQCLGCGVPFVWGMMGTNDQPLPSPGLVYPPALQQVVHEIFPEAPVSGYLMVGGWLNNNLRISELAKYEFDAWVFDDMMALLQNWARILPPPPTVEAAAPLVVRQREGGNIVGRAAASLVEWTHVPLLPSFFGEAVLFSRFATPLEAARVARVCRGYVGTDDCVAALPEGPFRQALANEFFLFRLDNNVEYAFPLTPVIVWFLQHGGEDTQALADYVAAWFKRPRLWTRSNRGTTRSDWRWFCRLVALAHEMYSTLTQDDVWRMLGLFLLEPPPLREGGSRDPRYYADPRAVRVLTPAPVPPEAGGSAPKQRRPNGSPDHAPEGAYDTRNVRRAEEPHLWQCIMDQSNLPKATMLLAGLHRRQPAGRSLPPRLCVAARHLPEGAGMERGFSCKCPGRKTVMATDADRQTANGNPEVALLLARGRECDGTCHPADETQNMPVRKHFRSNVNGAPAFNASSKTRTLSKMNLIRASLAPCKVWDQDDDMVIVPQLLWYTLLSNEYRVHGLDPGATTALVPPVATWKNQGTGVCFRGDVIPNLPVWEARVRDGRKLVEARTVTLNDLAPATLEDVPTKHYPPIRIEPLQSQRMCICQVHDHEDFDSRRSARVMAARGLQVGEVSDYDRDRLREADAYRTQNGGALPKLGKVSWPQP